MENYLNLSNFEKSNYALENGFFSYSALCAYMFDDMILCNNIMNLEEMQEAFFYPVCGSVEKEIDDYVELTEIYQYYIVSCFNDIDFMIDKYPQLHDELIIFYLKSLDLYILGVPHYGTGWNYVLTNLPIKE